MEKIDALIETVTTLRQALVTAESDRAAALAAVTPSYARSARNLVHYLALRSHDVRPLQRALTELGLSSLGRLEAHVLAGLDAVLAALRGLAGRAPIETAPSVSAPGFRDGPALLDRHTQELFGPPRPERAVRIMVTLPTEAASDAALLRDWLERGMDCARINCAHDGPATWERMVENVRRTADATQRPCQIMMDLAGPKLRTGPILEGPAVVKVRPNRDPFGRAIRAARLWLAGATKPPAAADAMLPVPAEFISTLAADTAIDFVDARGAKRELRVISVHDGGAWCDLEKTAYFVPGTELRSGGNATAPIGALPARAGLLELARGDTLLLTRELEPGRPAERDGGGRLLAPARIGCTLPQIFECVRTGEPVWFDDGRIGATVRRSEADALELEITHAGPTGERLRADKGINLPESRLDLPALTAKDRDDLAFVARHADIVALSFVQRPADIQELERLIASHGRSDLGIVLKIETRRAFEALPALLLETMRSPRDGVMIARGDLAVECGFERLAEVQEEILWICEAAHVPVIWATQVLETLAKSGRPSRAEITDAAMSERAECVMLNKGPHLAAAIDALADILSRMRSHQHKKRAMLRPLRLARDY